MAPEMQFLPRMKSVMGSLLSLVLVTSLQAAAEKSACVEMYRKANFEFQSKYAKLEQQKNELVMGAAVGGAAGVGCVLITRNLVGGVGCVLLGGITGGGAYGYSAIKGSQMQSLYDAQLLFQAYEDFQANPEAPSEAAQIIASDLGAQEADVNVIMQQVSSMMETGEICQKRQPTSYDETLDLLASRL